jgi:hypothetical protein
MHDLSTGRSSSINVLVVATSVHRQIPWLAVRWGFAWRSGVALRHALLQVHGARGRAPKPQPSRLGALPNCSALAALPPAHVRTSSALY